MRDVRGGILGTSKFRKELETHEDTGNTGESKVRVGARPLEEGVNGVDEIGQMA